MSRDGSRKTSVRGELTNKLGFQYWKGRKCEKDYWDQPWEKEPISPSRQTGSIRMGEHSMTVTELEVEIAWAFPRPH